MESDSTPDAREQRRRAVSMLKRAASLPRMEGGRRPRMHTDVVSEGEKPQHGREETPDIETPPSERVDELPPQNVTDEPEEPPEPPEELTVVRSPSRSRRRSRSRRSKDMKNRPATHGDSSPELAIDMPALPPSPGPVLGNLGQRQRMLRSPTPTGSLPPSAPPTPGIPSLEDIQRRGLLQRSQSAAGRQNAMNKLTGGTDVYDPSMSPSPTFGLRRNQTVSGDERLTEERSQARKHLLARLNPRIGKDDPNSGEDQPPAPTEVRRKRRRSHKRRSNPGVSDSDYITTSPNTPIPPTTPLPQTPIPPDYFIDIRARSSTPNYGLDHHSDDEPAESARHRRRSIVVEEEEDDAGPHPSLPSTPPQSNGSPVRLPHSSRASINSHSGLVNVPFYLSDETSSRHDILPISPFQTPTNARLRRDDDEEEVLYTRDSVTSLYDDREISWIAQPVQELVQDVELNDEDLADERPMSSHSSLHDEYEESSPRTSSVIIDSEPSPDTTPSHVPPSPSSLAALSHSASMTRASNDSISHLPPGLSVTEHQPLAPEFTDVEDRPESSAKRSGTWQKIKDLARAGSSAGRRSRTNSIRERRDHTDSSISRESGVSLRSSRTDKNDGSMFSMQQSQHFVTQSPAASLSVPTLSSPPPPPTSPVPPSASEYSRYQQDPKLFPFSAPKQLDKNASTPDVSSYFKNTPDAQSPFSPSFSSAPFSPMSSPDQSGSSRSDLHIGRQTSDTGMRIKYTGAPPPNISYIDIPQNVELPTTLLGVRKWMRVGKKPTTPDAASKKPSLTELLRIRKDTEIVTDREDSSSGTLFSPPMMSPQHSSSPSPTLRYATDTTESAPKASRILSSEANTIQMPSLTTSSPARPDPWSPTPDPSSTSEYPAHSVSSSSSTSSSNYSVGDTKGVRGALILQKLEDNLARSSRSPMWANAIERPPRELVISAAVLQVVNNNTVKDRYLFLFTDLLVIAKPINNQMPTTNPSPANNKTFIVKSVVLLHELRFTSDRTEAPAKSPNYASPPRNPILRTFVHQFKRYPDQAISTLFSSLEIGDDPVVLGQLLFRTTEIDRAQLGDYLARRTSKLVLKSYLDNFGFTGLRVDRALRAFLFSVHVPSGLEFLLDAFASRWYDANATFVAYDKDLAIRLVRAIVQVNDHLHGGLAQAPGVSAPIRLLHIRNFIKAFRPIDPSRLVSDELLRDLFDGIARERICMAVSTEASRDLLNITIKRRPPDRLTYKVQSEPVHLKLPQPDPHFAIHLFGQGLVFDPPVLTFAKSSEASFRITGVHLGQKTYIMIRAGPNALRYHSLSLSNTLTVERAFMRNTFQIAFVNHEGVKRRYMFNVNDPVIKHKWVTEIQRRCDDATSSRKSMASKFHRAIDIMAFRVLQDTLIGPVHPDSGPGRALDHRKKPGHVRSKSRSQVYQSQAGRHELDIGNGMSGAQDDYVEENVEGHKTWQIDDLTLHCQQNSSIGLLLSYLQVGSPAPEFS